MAAARGIDYLCPAAALVIGLPAPDEAQRLGVESRLFEAFKKIAGYQGVYQVEL